MNRRPCFVAEMDLQRRETRLRLDVLGSGSFHSLTRVKSLGDIESAESSQRQKPTASVFAILSVLLIGKLSKKKDE